MPKTLAAWLVGSSLVLSGLASAEPAPKGDTTGAAAATKGSVSKGAKVAIGKGSAKVAKEDAAPPAAAKAGAPRRDPRGVKGISPFMEALQKGDSALIARDFDGAIAAYREAIAKEPQNPLGHYRMGEAQRAKGDLHEAEEAFLSGLRFVPGTDLPLKAKLQFAIADLRERQKSYDEALAKWSEYGTTATEDKNAAAFPATAAERKKVIEAWKKISADSVEVKARIAKGVAAADEAVRKSSK
jgi:tetratricopeptide (TPR) repeat protein